MEIVAINGQPRTDLGKSATKAVRNAEMIPCVLYGGQEAVHFSVKESDVRGLIYTPDFKLANVSVNGDSYRCIVREIQFHPLTDSILHLDFLRLIDGNPVKIELPLRFKGVSPGVKSGGKLIQKVRRVKVKVLPEKIIDELLVDISGLELGQSLRIRDIEPGEGVEIVNAPGIPVATVEVPRALRSAASAAEKAAAKK